MFRSMVHFGAECEVSVMVHVFHIWLFQQCLLKRNILPFSNYLGCLLKINDQIDVGLFLDFLLCSIDLSIYTYANIILSSLLQFYSKS